MDSEAIKQVTQILESSVNPDQTQTITDVVERLESSIGEPLTTQTINDVVERLESSIGEPLTTQTIDEIVQLVEPPTIETVAEGDGATVTQQPFETVYEAFGLGATGEPNIEATMTTDINVISTAGEEVIVERNGVVGVGATEADAITNLNDNQSQRDLGIMASISDVSDVEITVENPDDGGPQIAGIEGPSGNILFEGDNAGAELNDLVHNHYDSNKPETALPIGLQITKNDSGYQLRVGNIVVNHENLYDGLAEVNSIRQEQNIANIPLDILPEADPVSSIIPVTRDGFNPEQTRDQLVKDGFLPLNTKTNKSQGQIGWDGFRAYKDGYIYDVEVVSSKAKRKDGSTIPSKHAIVTISDIDGNKYATREYEYKQEFLTNGALQVPVHVKGRKKDVNTDPQSLDISGVVLRPPTKGIQIKESDYGGPMIDTVSVESVARRIGGKVIYNSSNAGIIDVHGVHTSFIINSNDGSMMVTANGYRQIIDGPFMINNNSNPNVVTMTNMVRDLEADGYVVIDTTPNRTTLLDHNDERVTIIKEKI